MLADKEQEKRVCIVALQDRPAPADLSSQAIKAARRLQALPTDRAYDMMLIKRPDEWVLIIKDTQGAKTEHIR